MGGRKAVPIDLLLINGNKNRLTKKEIAERKKAEQRLKGKADNIEPPSELSPAAQQVFKQQAQQLQELGLITNVDVNQLAMYSSAYARWLEMQSREDVSLKELDVLFKQVKSMAAEFGFTPSSRAKLAMPKEEEKEPTKEDILFGDV